MQVKLKFRYMLKPTTNWFSEGLECELFILLTYKRHGKKLTGPPGA